MGQLEVSLRVDLCSEGRRVTDESESNDGGEELHAIGQSL